MSKKKMPTKPGRAILKVFAFSGQAIPYVAYTPEEVRTWGEVYRKAVELYDGRACSTHRKALQVMMKECGFAEDNIPQMEDVSNFLKSTVFLRLF